MRNAAKEAETSLKGFEKVAEISTKKWKEHMDF